MYQNQPRSSAVIALCFYALLIGGIFVMGMLYARGNAAYDWIYWTLFAAAVAIVMLRDKSAGNLGLGNVKMDIVLSPILAAAVVAISFTVSEKSGSVLLRGAWYYLIRIALVEEVTFRGFLQSYLFGIPWKRKRVYILGAACFSMMHVPFQMYVNQMVSLRYFLIAWPQLLFTFVFHLLMCWITRKRGNILLPVTIHFALDYLQAAL
jgi:membrane protease YdiL (CAAX protease family)